MDNFRVFSRIFNRRGRTPEQDILGPIHAPPGRSLHLYWWLFKFGIIRATCLLAPLVDPAVIRGAMNLLLISARFSMIDRSLRIIVNFVDFCSYQNHDNAPTQLA